MVVVLNMVFKISRKKILVALKLFFVIVLKKKKFPLHYQWKCQIVV